MLEEKGGVAAAIEAGRELGEGAGKARQLERGLPFTLVPEGQQIVPLADYLLKAPLHAQATPAFTSVASFIEYLTRFKTENTVVFGHPEGKAVVGIVDYHEPSGTAAWKDHRATLKLCLSPEWED